MGIPSPRGNQSERFFSQSASMSSGCPQGAFLFFSIEARSTRDAERRRSLVVKTRCSLRRNAGSSSLLPPALLPPPRRISPPEHGGLCKAVLLARRSLREIRSRVHFHPLSTGDRVSSSPSRSPSPEQLCGVKSEDRRIVGSHEVQRFLRLHPCATCDYTPRDRSLRRSASARVRARSIALSPARRSFARQVFPRRGTNIAERISGKRSLNTRTGDKEYPINSGNPRLRERGRKGGKIQGSHL